MYTKIRPPNPLVELFKPFFDDNKNTMSFDSLTKGSGKEIWWKCSLGHSFSKAPRRFKDGFICDFCSNSVLLVGFNDLKTKYPKVSEEWDYTKNNTNPEEHLFKSYEKVWWKCDRGHGWSQIIAYRTVKGYDCKECVKSNRLIVGENDLKSSFPQVALEWDYRKNSQGPENYTSYSSAKVWWKCLKGGHEWQAVITSRSRGTNCPICSNNIIVAGINDLATVNPELASQWNYAKNGDKTPNEFSHKSSKKIWWQCAKGHEWKSTISNRSNGSGCWVCSYDSRTVDKIKPEANNSFQDLSPTFAKEWHPTKNNGLKPSDFKNGSSQKVWWQCTKGHEWQGKICDRTFYKSGCRRCGNSNGEKELINFIASLNIPYSSSEKDIIKPYELDVYLPTKNIAIEYNGLYWHSEKCRPNKNYHLEKWAACKTEGIQLIQIWEDDWNKNSDLIKKMITHKMGYSNSAKTPARKLNQTGISTADAKAFFTLNHIQGYASGSHYIGLNTQEGVLLAAMILRKDINNNLTIIRYATSATIPGGFTKLLSYAEKIYQPDSFTTFSDHTVSDGKLYESNGFTADKELAPDYMYVVKGKRKHKFGYRLKRFKNDPLLQWEEGLTEKELAELNSLHRIWDAGKTRWVKHVR